VTRTDEALALLRRIRAEWGSPSPVLPVEIDRVLRLPESDCERLDREIDAFLTLGRAADAART
jgi:hypothetical protein